MGQFISGANVTKINMVTILGPVVLPIAIQHTFHQTPITRQEGGTKQHLHLKYTFLTRDTIRIPQVRYHPRVTTGDIKDIRTTPTTAIAHTVTTSNTITATTLATILMKIQKVKRTISYLKELWSLRP